MTNTMTVGIQSDIFAQVKPSELSALEELISSGSKHAPFAFKGKSFETIKYTCSDRVWAVQFLNFTNQQVYQLLSKSLKIVESTEEYALYILNEAFNSGKDKQYSTPPGTLRIYAKDLICFYNGKTWRALKV